MDAAAADLYDQGYAVAPITLKTRQAALAAARKFFELPDAVKRKAIAPKRQATRGYSPPHAENYAALGGVANQPNDAVEKLRLGAWLPFGGDASEAQDGVAWPREAKGLRDALVAFGEEAAAAAVRLVEACAARGGWAAPATGCRATLTINGYGFAGAPGVSPETCPEATTIDHQSPENAGSSGTLVAAHTDVGVLTLVTFDAGACGRLEFEFDEGGWRAAPADGLLIHAADGIAALAPGAPVIRHRVAATGIKGSRVSLALFVDLPPDHRVRGATTYAAWRRDRVRRARAVGAQKQRSDDGDDDATVGADERQTALRLYALTPALRPRRILTEAQIAAFIRDGYVVVPGVLSKERLAAARRGLAATLQRHGVSMEDAATHEGLRRLSTTRGAGGVLDLFYDRWKLDLTLATSLYADCYRDLFEVRRSVL
jgi:isopenicillin N synthase-like dioxygenase